MKLKWPLSSVVLMLTILFTPALLSYASETYGDPREVLALAKVTGACGIMDSMIDFQKKTQLEGGDEFVTRFWLFESARRGMTVQQVSDQCNSAISAYDKMWRSMEPENR
jgi:hypothetical protein